MANSSRRIWTKNASVGSRNADTKAAYAQSHHHKVDRRELAFEVILHLIYLMEPATRFWFCCALVYAKLSRLESDGTVLGLNLVWKFSCLTNHALKVCHSASGVSSSISKLRRNVGTSL